MKKTILLSIFALCTLNIVILSTLIAYADKEGGKPNIILILADDLGWGDISCNNANSKFKTPQIDKLASEGMLFANAHSPHSVCTPTRYSLLTGRYCWRTFMREGVLPGFSSPLISTNRLTLASLLKQNGYNTGAFGKWHIGLEWQPIDGDPGDFHFGTQIHASGENLAAICRRVNHEAPVKGGPTELGFDCFFGTPSNANRIPVFIRDNQVQNLDKIVRDKNGLIRDTSLRRDLVDDIYIEEATKLIKKSVNEKKPFFVYLALNAAHAAVIAPDELKGKSNLSDRGDRCLWVDRSVGKIMDMLKKNGLEKNTLVIFTSDNGPKWLQEDIDKGHDGSGPYRGYKTDIWDGGNREPFIVRWPEKIKENVVNNNLLCLTDMMATFSALIGEPLPDWAGEDSFNQLPAFFGESNAPLRTEVIYQSYTGVLALQKGKWKLILDTEGSGGFRGSSPPNEVKPLSIGAPWRHDMSVVGQLYNIEQDPYEENNLFHEHSDVVNKMKKLLKRYVNDGRTRKKI